jgi:hypothetical protein
MAEGITDHWRVICWDHHDVPYKADWFQDWDGLIEWLRKNHDAKSASHVDIAFKPSLPGRAGTGDLVKANKYDEEK